MAYWLCNVHGCHSQNDGRASPHWSVACSIFGMEWRALTTHHF